MLIKRKEIEITLNIYKNILRCLKYYTDEELIYKIVDIFFKTEDEDIREVYFVYSYILKCIDEVNNSLNFLKGEDEKIEYVGSIFDEIDEEQGYNEEEKNNKRDFDIDKFINSIIMYSINCLKNSYAETLNCEMIGLMSYIKYDMEHNRNNENVEEITSKGYV